MILDLVLILILAFFIYRGVRKGFAKSVLGLFSFVISIALAFCLYQPVSGFVKNSAYGQKIYEATREKLAGQVEIKLPGVLPGAVAQTVNEAAGNTLDSVSRTFSDMIINVLSFVLLIILIKILLFLLSKAVDLVAKLPLLKQANSFLGLLFGILNGAIFVMIVLAFFSSTQNLPWGGWFVAELEKSALAKALYDKNFLLLYIGK